MIKRIDNIVKKKNPNKMSFKTDSAKEIHYTRKLIIKKRTRLKLHVITNFNTERPLFYS